MSQIITSPLSEYPGSITLPDGLTLYQMAEWEKVLDQLKYRAGERGIKAVVETADTWLMALPTIITIVEKWEITGIPEHPTVENTKFTPYREYRKFSKWVFNLISALFLGEKDIPKVFGGPSSIG